MTRLYLSPPHLTGHEASAVYDALASGWVAPCGPQVDAFEEEFAQAVGSRYALATSSGTAALHLALHCAGVQAGDEVMVSALTFVASANPILYLGARPVFVDSERDSWGMDPDLICENLQCRKSHDKRIGAVVLVHLYGNPAIGLEPIRYACRLSNVPLIEDAAEALGASIFSYPCGTLGKA